tara:strand:- start:502 stop:663 length:162 start_codon:yes stop_codon:yes gene_type:complete
MLVLEGAEIRTLQKVGLEVGAKIESIEHNMYQIGSHNLEINSNLASQILIRTL